MRAHFHLAIAIGAFAACIATVARAEYRQSASRDEIALARSTCAEVMRIPPGFVPFDACVENLAQTLTEKNSRPMGLQEADATSAINHPEQTSYSQSSSAERRRKEEYACARLGIMPGVPGFGQCVTGLDSALRSTEHSD